MTITRSDIPADTASETPRALTAREQIETMLRYQHEERMARAEQRKAPGYQIDLKRSNSGTSLGVVAIDLHGEQRDDQTAEDFIKEQRALFDALCAAYPMPDGYVRAK